MNHSKKQTLDVREACITEAMKIMEAKGVEAVNMREVARRLGVSHQAPYKHFESRDHVLAEIVTRAFDSFADHLDQAGFDGGPADEVERMVQAYFYFSQKHPYLLQLMFNTQLPDQEKHPDMLKDSKRALRILCDSIAKLPTTQADPNPHIRTEVDALFVWSAIHGFSSIVNSYAWDRLNFSDDVRDSAIKTIAQKIKVALGIEPFRQ